MYEKRIGCLPILDGDDLVGIVTSSDVMEALVRLVSAHEPGSRIEVALPDRPGELAAVAGIIRDESVNIVSVLSSEREDGKRVTVFRLDTIDPRGITESLEEAGYLVLWPPGAGDSGTEAGRP
jgi:acetoin utilization protein AcuB